MTGLPDKQSVRREVLARRKAFHASDAAQSATASAVSHMLAFLEDFTGQPVAGYMPIQSEIDPLGIMSALVRRTPVAVPVIRAAGHALDFHRWDHKTPMETGKFGALIPIHGKTIVPFVVIVPLVAFTPEGHRLGYGGGYYDRTLAQLRNASGVMAVGLAYGVQEVARFDTEATDQRLDALVTEHGLRRF